MRPTFLTLHAERVERPVVRAAPTPGAPVRFEIAVEGVAGDKSAVLETNEMRSFVGQSVEYSFQFGPAEGRESLRLILLPVSISEGMMTMEQSLTELVRAGRIGRDTAYAHGYRLDDLQRYLG
jgi:hypothetical protein